MICGEKCFEIFGISNNEKNRQENFPIGNDDTERNQIQIEQIKIKNDFLSNSDIGSESDSGLGSVRTSKKDEIQNQASIRAAESTICTVTRADSMGTLAQDCISIEDEFNLLPMMEGGESLTDLVLFEFKKLNTIDILQLKHDFDQYESSTRKKRENRPVCIPDMNLKKSNHVIEQQPRDQPRDQPRNQVREKKMRKKRKMTRKRIDSIKEDSSSTDSDRDQPIRNKPSKSSSTVVPPHEPVIQPVVQPRGIMKKTSSIVELPEAAVLPHRTQSVEENVIIQQSVVDLKKRFESV